VSAAVALGFLASAGLVWQSSRAAFTAQSDSTGNSWSAGTVAISSNSPGGALFTAGDLKPGDTDTACVAVTYGGSVDATVRLYVAAGDLAGDLGNYLNLTVEQGTAGPSCAAMAGATTVYTGSLGRFAATSAGFASGAGTWSPAGASGATRVYRFTWGIVDDNAAQGRSATAKFTWEAQNV
jgi:hypothetical protein